MKGKIKFKAQKINPFSDDYTILRMLVFLFLTVIFNHTLLGQGNCEECKNPIVELKNLEGGNVESAADDINEMNKEFGSWHNLIGKNLFFPELAKSDIFVFDVLQRGFELFSGLKKRNPCTDIYYTYEDFENEIIRFGAKEGQAKYNIKSMVNIIKKAAGGEKALVRHIVYQVTELDVPRKRYFKIDESHTIEIKDRYDVKEISNH